LARRKIRYEPRFDIFILEPLNLPDSLTDASIPAKATNFLGLQKREKSPSLKLRQRLQVDRPNLWNGKRQLILRQVAVVASISFGRNSISLVMTPNDSGIAKEPGDVRGQTLF
jgi:hypothetical protein